MEDKITRKELYQELWKGRDLELTSLWQRSIFLMSFLLIAFTAYCGLWVILFNKENSSIYELLLMDFGFIFISVFGLMTSILWIMMSKGSKYWYEKYEGSISKIIEDGELNSDELTNSDRYQEFYKEGFKLETNTIFSEYPVYYPRHGYLANIAFTREQVNNCLISTKAGQFSVSKVNIGIGIVTGWLWILLVVLHLFLFYSLWGRSDGSNSLSFTYVTALDVFLLEVSSPEAKTATSLLFSILPKWTLWFGIYFPGLYFTGFAVMCWCGLFSSSESKMLKRRELKKKIKFYFPKKEVTTSDQEKNKVGGDSDTTEDLSSENFKKVIKKSFKYHREKASSSEPSYNSQWPLFSNERKNTKLAKNLEKQKVGIFLNCLNYRELCYVDTLLNLYILTSRERYVSNEHHG